MGKRAAATALAAAEKAMAMHAFHAQHVEQLRTAKLEDVLKRKVELHISVPRITLNYNNAPPLHVSAAAALSEDKVRSFLEAHVFPHFEPLWACLDGLSRAPDGSTKKDYSTKMLDRLAVAIKAFITKAQTSDGAALGSADANVGAGSSSGAPVAVGDSTANNIASP